MFYYFSKNKYFTIFKNCKFYYFLKNKYFTILGLGVMDLSQQNYKTLLRAHSSSVLFMDYHPLINAYLTLSDGSLSI